MICKLISDPHLSLQRLIVPAGLTRPDEWRRGRIHHLITRCSCRCSGRKPDGHDENSHPSHSFLHEGSARCQQDVSHEKITFLSSFPAEQGGASTPSKSWGMLLKNTSGFLATSWVRKAALQRVELENRKQNQEEKERFAGISHRCHTHDSKHGIRTSMT